jgi:hypothetical protein
LFTLELANFWLLVLGAGGVWAEPIRRWAAWQTQFVWLKLETYCFRSTNAFLARWLVELAATTRRVHRHIRCFGHVEIFVWKNHTFTALIVQFKLRYIHLHNFIVQFFVIHFDQARWVCHKALIIEQEATNLLPHRLDAIEAFDIPQFVK